LRAVLVDQPGGPEELRAVDLPEPLPAPGEVVIQVAYAALNWGDIQKRQGIYPDPVSYPAVLGAEVSGTIARCGKGVVSLKPGQFVAAITGPRMLGGYAGFVAVPQDYVLPLPPNFDPRLAAAFPIATLTAFHLLHTAHRIRRGEIILVHAIGGAVGLALTQLAKRAGAVVLGTVGSAAKAARPLALGADLVIARDEQDFVDVVLAETKGRGVDLVIDSLGAEILDRSFDALRRFGRLINIGEAAGEPDFPIRKRLYERSTSMAGFEVLHAGPGSRRWRLAARRVVELLASGQLKVPIAAEFPLDRVPEAHAFLESRRADGKIIIAVGS
jgi:NADPH2:quinone reductase